MGRLVGAGSVVGADDVCGVAAMALVFGVASGVVI